ncbi:MAG: hypothetical protein AB1696_26270 [Planctomycetota bacterium]
MRSKSSILKIWGIVLCGGLALLANMAEAEGEESLLRNGDFAEIGENGCPVHWTVGFTGAGGSPRPEGNFAMVDGPNGRKALKITCTACPLTPYPKWITLSQRNTLVTKRGERLYISFWARKENIKENFVQVGIRNLKPWANIMETAVMVSDDWQQAETVVTPVQSSDNTSFQITFPDVYKGATLYLSDVKVTKTDKEEIEYNPVRRKMEREIKEEERKNHVFNGDFEIGLKGWATENLDYNVVKLDENVAYRGRRSARIDLDESSLPKGYRDYPRSEVIPCKEVFFATEDWIRVEKGKEYTLSCALRSSKPGMKVNLGFFYMTRAKDVEPIVVGPEWGRHELRFTARDLFGFVGIVARTTGPSDKIWIDSVQLERGGAATEYSPKYPVEAALYTRRDGNIYYAGEKVEFRLVVCQDGPDVGRVKSRFRVEDHQGNIVYQDDQKGAAAISHAYYDHQGGVVDQGERGIAVGEGNLQIPIADNGHYKLLNAIAGENFSYDVKQPFVVIYPYAEAYGKQDSRLGVNHAFYFDLCQKLSKDAGVTWVRDWNLTWNIVEPEQGRFDFSGAETSYRRLKDADMRMLGSIGDPTSEWASSAPKDVQGKRLGDSIASLWYLPRDMEFFRAYIRKCFEVFGGRIQHWEIFNEPYKTQDWKVDEKYEQFLRIVKEEARRTNSNVKILCCGMVYFHDDEAMRRACELSDIISEHYYPQYNDTKRFLRHIAIAEDFLRKHNLRNDIWVTEFAKYADDDPHFQHASFDFFLSSVSENVAAAYSIKYITALFSHGTSKVFFHNGSVPLRLHYKPHNLHQDVFFKYGPTLHKLFVALNAFSWRLPPGASSGTPINEEGPIFAYSFTRNADKTLVLWADGADVPVQADLLAVLEKTQGLFVYSMMGRKLDTLRTIGDEPIYLTGEANKMEAVEKALAPK